MRALGLRPDGEPWTVAVEAPDRSVARRIPSSRSTMRLSRPRATTGTGSMSAAGGCRTPWTRRAADRSRRRPPRSRSLRRPAWSPTPGRPRSWCEEAWRVPNLRVDSNLDALFIDREGDQLRETLVGRLFETRSDPGVRPDPGMHIMNPLLQDRLKVALLVIALLGLVSGLGLWVAGKPDLATLHGRRASFRSLLRCWSRSSAASRRERSGSTSWRRCRCRRRLLFGETLAAAVVALMYSGGTFLESFAEGRARREMSDLLSRVPRTATRHRNGALDEVPLDDIAPGDLLLIRQGDVAPVDGTVESDRAMLDQSALTGESMPVRLDRGQDVMSGSTNAGDAFDLRVTRRAADSTYAGIVRLVEAAQKSKAPMARLADRYSLLFLAVTVDAGDRRLVVHRRSDPRGGGPGGGDTLSADPCRSGGAGGRAVAGGAFRRADQGREAAGGAGADPDADPRQDRHADRRAAADRVHRHTRRHVRGRSPALCRGARSGVEAPDRAGDRRGGPSAGRRPCRFPKTWSRRPEKALREPSRAGRSWWAAQDFVAVAGWRG